MKKKVLSILLVLVLVLSFSLVMAAPVAAAGGGKWVNAQRVPLYPVDYGSSDYVRSDLPSQGNVILVDPMGNVTFVIQGNVEGLTPNHSYTIWIRDLDPGYTGTFIKKYAPLGYYMLDTFTTNDEGRGKFHLNIRAEDLSAGEYQIQLAINDPAVGGANGLTVLATVKYIQVTIGCQ